MKLLNIGCGNIFHEDWINLDFNINSHYVMKLDIIKGLPFKKNSFNAVYSSHFLEHLKRGEAFKFLKDTRRVLKNQGIIRVVVPDLESIVKLYLKKLKAVFSGNKNEIADYEWIMLELFDQAVRDESGGEMKKYLSNRNITNKDFILSRLGYEAENILKKIEIKSLEKNDIKTNLKKLHSRSLQFLFRKTRYYILKIIISFIGGIELKHAFDEGVFRNSGEVHRWIYDFYSLKRLLESVGFREVQRLKANQSNIKNFNIYSLEIVNGKIRHPSSIFVEAFK